MYDVAGHLLTEGKEMRAVIRHLRAAALCSKGDGPCDGHLLESFIVRRDEAAFEALVRRHGPMVLGVCQRVLRNVHDAEDAFQATFLVLSRKADSVKPRDMVGNWLYGVAYRTAMKARAMNAKRRSKERHSGAIPPSGTSASGVDEVLLEQLDHELNRLPEKYRVAIVLCELEGRSRKEVARLLGVPEGTLSWRLAHAKKLLARRLSRYGTVALATLISKSAASACLTPALRVSAVKAALTAGAIPAKVLALTEGVMKAMLLSKLKITACAAALMLTAGMGATGLTYRATAEQPALASRAQTDELEALRLEMEALRKSLLATRERVKTLESEVNALKGRTDGIAEMRKALLGAGGGMQNQMMHQMHMQGQMGMRGSADVTKPQTARGQGMGIGLGGRGGQTGANSSAKMPDKTTDPVSDAEAALKKLRANPSDKQATEELERALKRLKEQEKPKGDRQDSAGR
jgi:RNA polymerase sigma-70 factor (ECF subfamily)